MKPLAAAFALVLAAPAAFAAEAVDLEMVGRIRDEGLNRSQVMETVTHLTDRIGPRLTGSPNLRRANEWTRKTLEDWGLSNARLEPWGPFGRGWSLDAVSARMVAPETAPLVAIPRAWTPGTGGPVKGALVRFEPKTIEEIDEAKGTLSGKIVLLKEPREIKTAETAAFDRYDEGELAELAGFSTRARRPWAENLDRDGFLRRNQLQKRLRAFLREEGVLAALEPSDRDAGIVRVSGGGSREPGEEVGVPTLVVAAEQYNRLARLVAAQQPVEVEIDVRARFHEDGTTQHNTLADIPGTDRRGEVVMIGAHLDSWHAGTGATDNAAGVAVAMEAMRILKTLGVAPKRTIRVALWTGEEQGLLGSRAYVAEHFGSRPAPAPEERELPSHVRKTTGPLTLKPEHARLAAYFNLDNGTGRVRGVYTQQNVAAAPIFEAWLAPLRDLGATAVSNRDTGGTDHLPFDQVGLPGFQFIQDQADYFTTTHHTHVDVLDRVQKEDLAQAAVVMATFAYHAAMREERFPRKALPADAVAAGPAPRARH